MKKQNSRRTTGVKRTKLALRKETTLHLTSQMLEHIAGGRDVGSELQGCDSMAADGCGGV